MLDTFKGGYRFNRSSAETYLRDARFVENSLKKPNKIKYHRRTFKIDSKSKNSNAPVYKSNVLVSCSSDSNKRVLFRFYREKGYKNSYDLLIKSELSHFNSFSEFIDFIEGINISKKWKKIIRKIIISEIHIKLDLNMDIRVFIGCMSFPYAHEPKIFESCANGLKTFYITRNFYTYEKSQAVRLEIRVKRPKQILKKLSANTIGGLLKNGPEIKSPFGKVDFYWPLLNMSSLSGKERDSYLFFIRSMLNRKYKILKTKNGSVRVYENSFVNSMRNSNAEFNNYFSKEVKSKMTKINIGLCHSFYEQRDKFFYREIKMENNQVRRRPNNRGEKKTKVEVLPPESEAFKENSFNEFCAVYDSTDFSREELEVIYLRGYQNMNFADLAKTLRRSKSVVREMAKKLEDEIANVRLERNLEVRRQCGALKEDVEDAKSMLVGKAVEVLKKKLKSERTEMNDMSVERLIKLISDNSTDTEFEFVYRNKKNVTAKTGLLSPKK